MVPSSVINLASLVNNDPNTLGKEVPFLSIIVIFGKIVIITIAQVTDVILLTLTS